MPGGFKWVGSLSNDPHGKIRTFDVASSHATRLAPGDVMRITGTANATTGLAGIDAAAAGQSITGVLNSVEPSFATESFTDTGVAASTAATVKVNDDPFALYEVDTSATLAVADVGLNADIVVTAATQSGGISISNMTLDSSTKATTVTLQFRIVGLLPGTTTGVLGDRALVMVNNSTNKAGAVGV